MTESEELTLAALHAIRDEIRGTNARLDQTNARLDQTNARLDQTNARLDQTNARLDETIARVDRLDRRQTANDVRVFTELAELHGTVRDLRDAVVADQLRSQVADHERRITALEHRD